MGQVKSSETNKGGTEPQKNVKRDTPLPKEGKKIGGSFKNDHCPMD